MGLVSDIKVINETGGNAESNADTPAASAYRFLRQSKIQAAGMTTFRLRTIYRPDRTLPRTLRTRRSARMEARNHAVACASFGHRLT